MTFVQPEFLALALATFALYWLLPSRRVQNALLIVVSIVFYGWVHPWFVALLAFSTVLDYGCGLAMARWPERRGRALAVSLLGNLGMLGVFKYFDFFAANVAAVLQSLGIGAHPVVLDLLLPVGISFYTFQTLSYTIDVYRGVLKPRRDFLDYAVYVSFFPQLVAGPIERATHFLPQVEAPRAFVPERIRSGIVLATWGAFKKVCIADMIAPYVDRLHMLDHMSGPLVFVACFAFAVQIYADFSGYTDIARGVARMLGFELTINFHRPFLATSTPDFWQRWHISLGSWIGDYLYTPLARWAGSGGLQLFAAIMVTFVVMGLWHGAAWTFVVLGAWYGLWVAFYTFVTPAFPTSLTQAWWSRWFAIAFHLTVVMIPGGLLFREISVARVWQHLVQNPFVFTADELVVAWVVGGIALVFATPMMLSVPFEDHLLPRLQRSRWLVPLQSVAVSAWGAAIFLLHRDTSYDFIYFQF